MALTKTEISLKLQMPEWKAWLDTIAFCEGADYNIIYSGATFDDFSDHPERVICSGNYCSSAAGRYQIMDYTWRGKNGGVGLKQRIPLNNFTPNSQDVAAVWLIANDRRVDVSLIEQGAPNFNNFDKVSSKLSAEWCSLPGTNRGACEGQPVKSLQTAYNFYTQALAWRRGLGPEPTGLRNEGEGQGDTGALAGFRSPFANGFPSLFSGVTNISQDYCALIRPLRYIDAKAFAGCDKRIDLNFFGGPNGVGAASNPLASNNGLLTDPSIPNFINVDPNSIKYGEFIVPLEKYTFISGFGPRWGRLHRGVDLSAPTGTPSAAPADGIVVASGWGGDYGNRVVIKHTNGLYTLHAHFSQIKAQKDQTVRQGQVIGLIGSTGFSTGPHLHLEVSKSYSGGYLSNQFDPRTVFRI